MSDDPTYDALKLAQTVGRERMNKRGSGARFLPGSKGVPQTQLHEVPDDSDKVVPHKAPKAAPKTAAAPVEEVK